MDILQAKAAVGPWIDTLEAAHEGSTLDVTATSVRAVAFAPIVSDGRLMGLLTAGADETVDELASQLPSLVEFAALGSALLGPGLRSRSSRDRERDRLREIISAQAFSPVFQPIVDMTDGSVLGYEALSRFRDRTAPDVVFGQAVEAGIGLELEEATIRAALQASVHLPSDTFLDINVSPEMVMAVEPLRTLLATATCRVILEITEHVGIGDYVALREAGVALGHDIRFAVDDAGAGFASLRHILELAPSHVKLDRALVSRIDTDPARQALVAGLVHFAAAIDSRLVAEGVETRAERDSLLELGVRVGQGYLLGRPAPVQDLVDAGHAIRGPAIIRPSQGG
jgi:EAL domain-containing protein (putative c-di-GMP-specific phosphodiesterase class I)